MALRKPACVRPDDHDLLSSVERRPLIRDGLMKVTIAKSFTDDYMSWFAPSKWPLSETDAQSIVTPVIEQAVASHRRPSTDRYAGEFCRASVAMLIPIAGPAALATYRVRQQLVRHVC